MIFNLFLIIYDFKQSDLISLHDTITSSKVSSHSLTSRHFQFFVKNIPIKEQADKV